MVAPDMTAPWGSTTVPVIVPAAADWPMAGNATINPSMSAVIRARTVHCKLSRFIKIPPKLISFSACFREQTE
jgi:hypothetical protein